MLGLAVLGAVLGLGLNALSGIGGVQTTYGGVKMSHNLSPEGLNALSGIGGVQTQLLLGGAILFGLVLMPCRALEAFRPRGPTPRRAAWRQVLMPCRALEAFRLAKGGWLSNYLLES